MRIAIVSTLLIGLSVFTSCKKYKKYSNGEVVENTYTGTVNIGSTGAEPGGDMLGNGDSGTYSFAWDNSTKKASLDFDITSPSGSVQFIINDAKGKEMLNKTLSGGSGTDSYSGISEAGKSGRWLVTMILTNFNGDGSYSVAPVD